MNELQVPNIPKPLNEPVKMSRFEGADIHLFLSTFGLLWLVGSFIAAVVIALFFVWLRRLLKKSEAGDLTQKGKYWFFPNRGRFKSLPPSHIREIVG